MEDSTNGNTTLFLLLQNACSGRSLRAGQFKITQKMLRKQNKKHISVNIEVLTEIYQRL